jgi:CubicO group peptidase (beta-lactamase class C family)
MKKILILMLVLTASANLKSQSPDVASRIDSMIMSNVSNLTPGCVVGVVQNGKIIFKHVYGLSNLDYRIPISDSTLFNLASVSKQFTAYLVLLLEKEGKLSLDDSLQKYIPELKYCGNTITIRQLLHHTSGIPSTDNLRLFAGLSLENPWDAEDEMTLIKAYQKLNCKPGEEQIYSNAGYFLLTGIVEKITGQPFSQTMSEKIFAPLGMKTAVIYDTPGKIIHNRASGYKKTGEIFAEVNTSGESIYGSTNLYASVNDMIQWLLNFNSAPLGGQQLKDRLFNPADRLNNGDTINYTYGLSVNKHRGFKMADHGGFTMGFRSHIMFLPEAGFSVFVLTNNESTDTWKIANTILDWYLKDLLNPEIKTEHKEIIPDKNLYSQYKGSFLMPDGMVLRFDDENDTLKLIIEGAPKFIMHPEKENEFFIKDFDAQCTFVSDSKGTVNEIIWHQSNQNPKGVRYTEPRPLTISELQQFTGKYECPELSVTYPVFLNENKLNITLPKTFRMVNIDTNMKLKHVSGDKFYGTLGLIEFRRNKEGKVSGFTIADVGRLRKIDFTKRINQTTN